MKKALIPALLVPLAGNALAASIQDCLDLNTSREMQRCVQGHNPTARVFMHEGSPVILDNISSIEGDYAAYLPDPVDQMNSMMITEINSVLLEKTKEH